MTAQVISWLKPFWDTIALKVVQDKTLYLINRFIHFRNLIMGWPITKYERRALFNLMVRDKDFRIFWVTLTLLVGLGIFLAVNRRWHSLKRRLPYLLLQKYHLFFQSLLYYLNRTFFSTPETFIGYSLALWEDRQKERALKIIGLGLTEYPKSEKLRQTLQLLEKESD